MPEKDNPKLIRALKDGKDELEYLVTSVWPGDAEVHASGAKKYGKFNWRIDKIKASTYKAAILRHFRAWFEGEDIDPDSGVSHLYHIRACCAILLDSAMHGTLIDDREVAESIDEETNNAEQDDGDTDDFNSQLLSLWREDFDRWASDCQRSQDDAGGDAERDDVLRRSHRAVCRCGKGWYESSPECRTAFHRPGALKGAGD